MSQIQSRPGQVMLQRQGQIIVSFVMKMMQRRNFIMHRLTKLTFRFVNTHTSCRTENSWENSEGDMHALDASYHQSCMTSLSNCVRNYKAEQVKDTRRSKAARLVLAELVSYMRNFDTMRHYHSSSCLT